MEKILEIQRKLLKQGRGFDFQSHGVGVTGNNFYNFALYPINKSKGKTKYYHSKCLDDLVEKVEKYMINDIDFEKKVEVDTDFMDL